MSKSTGSETVMHQESETVRHQESFMEEMKIVRTVVRRGTGSKTARHQESSKIRIIKEVKMLLMFLMSLVMMF